jgi:hypothetical protein
VSGESGESYDPVGTAEDAPVEVAPATADEPEPLPLPALYWLPTLLPLLGVVAAGAEVERIVVAASGAPETETINLSTVMVTYCVTVTV